MEMKKLIRHKWNQTDSAHPFTKTCSVCGCVKYWDFDYNCIMYQWGTHVTYRAPTCIIMNGVPYNPVNQK